MENLYVSEKCDLKAKWIWSDINTKGKNLYSFFRKKLSLSGEYKMYISSDTRYELYIDGKLYNRGGVISPKDYKAVDMHHINFDSGEHVIGVIVHYIGCVCAATKLMQAGLIVEMRGSNGELVITDSSWKSVASDAFYHEYPLMSHFGFPVVCDYNKIPSDWASVDFDDSSWNSAVEISNASENIYGILVEKDIPNLSCVNIKYNSILSFGIYVEGKDIKTNAHIMASRKREVLKNSPKLDECFNTENTFIVVDMGREVSGHVSLEFENAKSGQIIDIGYDELCVDGIPNPKRTYVNFADRVILRDAQKNINIFEARGFRYLLIDINFMPEGFKIVDISVDERVYQVNKSGYFKSSKSIYETLYNNSLQTIRLCMLDTYVDCPSRERVLWMDSYIEALFAVHCTDDTLLWKRVLFLYAQDCVKEGDLKGFVKGYCLNDYNNVIIMYVLYYVSSVIDYVYLSGDIESGKRLIETIKNQFSGLENFKNDLGFIDSDLWDSWDFVEWCAMDLDGASATINALYIYTLKRASKYFNFMGDNNYSLELKAISEDLSEKFVDYFSIDNSPLICDAVRGGVKSKAVSQLSNSMAVMANVFDKERNIKILNKITDDTKLAKATRGDYRISKDFVVDYSGIVPFGTPANATVLLKVLFDNGLIEKAFDYLDKIWIPMMKNGTMCEHIVEDANTSYCHAWSSAPVWIFARYVLGIKNMGLGFNKISICPNLNGLDYAEGVLPTKYGDIYVKHEKVDGKINTILKVPSGVEVV